jgi:hypothetical protein
MNSIFRSSRQILSLVCALGMLCFTFVTLAWFSDRGLVIGFEIPVGTKSGVIGTLADLFWMVAPFCLLAAVFLGAIGQKGKKIAPALAALPLFGYAFFEMAPLALFGADNVLFSQIFTQGFLLLLGAFAFVSVFVPESRSITAFLALAHLFLQIFLALLSFLFGEKYSWFYFSQLIPFGRYDSFRYTFFVISVFLYYLCYSLALALLLLPQKECISAGIASPNTEKALESAEKSALSEEEQASEEESTDLSSLSLEDFGIER